MQSLKVKFNGNGQEVLEYTTTYGQFKAEQRYGVGVIAFRKWLKEETGNENYGLIGELASPVQDIGDVLVEAILRKLASMQKLLEEKDKRIEFLQLQQKPKNEESEARAIALMQACKS